MSGSDASPGWFRRHFGEEYRIIYQGRGQSMADHEALGAIRELGLRPSDRVLDLCCGYGRHLSAFAKHGIRAIGVDLSMALLRQVDGRLAHRVVCADMRALPFSAEFSAVVNFFTSFGYFDSDEEHLLAAKEIVRVLRADGRFAMDLMNAQLTIDTLAPRTERRAGPFRVVESRAFDPARRRIEKQVELLDERSGCVKRCAESVRVFAAGEISGLLREAGLEVVRLLGGFDGAEYGPRSQRMIVIGRKRA